MGGKHLKKLRAEKAKVQLKKKKLLPKGQNVTDTSFKTKKIITIEQLKKVDENVPVSAWNLTLKDLITRLNHYNYMTRLNSLNGIKELITNYSQILMGPSLRIIVTRVMELLIDNEHKLRTTAISFLDDLFNQLPSHFLIPFHDLLNVHVCCAMTHREVSIQQDALKFVDVMIKHAPQAVEKNFPNLVQNFVRILSGYKYGHHLEVKASKKAKGDLEKSKTEVLQRFYKLLRIVYSETNNTDDNSEEYEVSSKKPRFELRKVDNPYTKIPDLSLFKVLNMSQNIMGSKASDKHKEEISVIVPILFDIWAEFAPNSKSDEFTSECLLTDSIAQLLQVILQIFHLLYEKAVQHGSGQLESWFVSTYSDKFFKVMRNFPYLPAVCTSKPGQTVDGGLTSGKSAAFTTQNLILCYLYHKFHVKSKNHELTCKVEKYILGSLHIKNPTDFRILAKIVDTLVGYQEQENLEVLITAIVKVHDATSILEYRRMLFDILAKLAFSESKVSVREIGHFKKWLKSLPQKLLEPSVPYHVVETILRVINQKSGKEILEDIESKASLIVTKLPNVRVEGKEELSGRKLVANILCRCSPSVTEAIWREVLGNDAYPRLLKEYIVDIISYKLKDQQRQNGMDLSE
ncbi:hypothetical protein RUM43_002458 [Polyplax serrata]|uniref:Pre-rRNA-processing protein Ipi1 N-terminal domain-containing protein n=1 Tax=Polyplax serrata TaxID=468196 RepID=A0AAN8RVX6_POLSC